MKEFLADLHELIIKHEIDKRLTMPAIMIVTKFHQYLDQMEKTSEDIKAIFDFYLKEQQNKHELTLDFNKIAEGRKE